MLRACRHRCLQLQQRGQALTRPSSRLLKCRCRASSEPSGDGDTPAGPAKTARTAPRPQYRPKVFLGPDGKPIKVVPVENVEKDGWEGVAQVDSGEFGQNIGRIAALVAGDTLALTIFAAIGRANHGEPGAFGDVLGTAAPFLLAWFAVSPWVGAFGKDAQGNKPWPAAAAAAKGWITATPVGLVFRGLSKGYVPPTPFIIVSMMATGVLLVGWRFAFANAAPGEDRSGNRKGNPLEFLSLLTSLVRRW